MDAEKLFHQFVKNAYSDISMVAMMTVFIVLPKIMIRSYVKT